MVLMALNSVRIFGVSNWMSFWVVEFLQGCLMHDSSPCDNGQSAKPLSKYKCKFTHLLHTTSSISVFLNLLGSKFDEGKFWNYQVQVKEIFQILVTVLLLCTLLIYLDKRYIKWNLWQIQDKIKKKIKMRNVSIPCNGTHPCSWETLI